MLSLFILIILLFTWLIITINIFKTSLFKTNLIVLLCAFNAAVPDTRDVKIAWGLVGVIHLLASFNIQIKKERRQQK